MQKLIFKKINSVLGLILIVLISAVLGGVLIRQAWSFTQPGAGPADDSAFGWIRDKIGSAGPASTLFAGQQVIYDAIAGIGGGGEKPVFVKCQVKHSQNSVYPNCPAGWGPSIHNYSQAWIYRTSQRHGIIYDDIGDSDWFYYDNPGEGEYGSTLACAVCQKN